MKKILSFSLLLGLTHLAHADQDFSGIWIEIDSSASLSKLVVQSHGDEVRATAFGNCKPIQCNWGEATVEIQSDGSALLGYVQKDKIYTIKLSPPNNDMLKGTLTSNDTAKVGLEIIENVSLTKNRSTGTVWTVVK